MTNIVRKKCQVNTADVIRITEVIHLANGE